MLASLILSVTFAGAHLDIAADGKPAAVIVTPGQAPNPVRFAAEELKHYLDRMTGGTFAITHTLPTDGAAIVLGEDLAKAAGIDVSQLTRDGYRIKTVGRHVYVAGVDDRTGKSQVLFTVKQGRLPKRSTNSDRYRAWGDSAWDFQRGTLHGAYDLLERLGVRWFFAGPKGEVVPTRKHIRIEPPDVTEQPHWLLRVNGRVLFPSKRYIKLGVIDVGEYDALGWSGRDQRLWMVRNRTSSEWIAFNHRPARHQWAKRFAKTHPEYFALLDTGKRALGPKREYLCYTDPGVVRETLADMEAYWSGKKPESRGIQSVDKYTFNNGWHPNACYGSTFSLLPNDGLQVDRSEASRPFLHEDMPFPHRHSDYVWQFVAKVAREAQKRFPGKLITCLAYQAYWELPQTVKRLPDNVVVGLAALSGPGRIHRAVDPKSYAAYFDLIRRWHAMNSQPMLFWKYWLYRYKQADRNGVPMLLPRFAGKLLKDLGRYGRYMFMQHDSRDIVFEHINRYVVYRLLWDPSADVDAILADYARSFYGPGAPVMKPMLDDMEKRCTQIARKGSDRVAIWEKVFTAEVMQRYRSAIDKAAGLTQGTPHAEAVRLMDMYFIAKMEAGRKQYVTDLKQVRESGGDLVRARTARAPITIDGDLSERVWKRARKRHLRNNVDGKHTRLRTRVRVLYTTDTLYCSFECADPKAREHAKVEGRRDYVEIFLDPDYDRSTYYWLQVKITGELADHLFPGPGEPPDAGWKSNAKAAVKVYDDRWTVELAIPLAQFAPERKKGPEEVWGVNFCRTQFDAPRPKDQFSSASPFLRGRFHQPGLFARLVFEK
jgi:uncharacterized protein DUF4838/cellulose/xylan binding protein with CBM9 domain